MDDNQWHDVVVYRDAKNISVTVDRLRVTGISNSPFTKLDLDDTVSVGGVKNPNQRGIVVQENFRGCIENVILQGEDLIEGIHNRVINNRHQLWRWGGGRIVHLCMTEGVVQVTFSVSYVLHL